MRQDRAKRNELLNKLKDKLSEINKSGKGGMVSLNILKKTKRPRITKTRTLSEVLKAPQPQKEKEKRLSTVLKGAVKWFNNRKGYGFIIGKDGNQYFFHHTEIADDIEERDLSDGYEVEFKVGKSDKGLQATNVSKQK